MGSDAPAQLQYEIWPGDDVEGWFRNVRRRIEVELCDNNSLQVLQDAVADPTARRPSAGNPFVCALPQPQGPTIYSYTLQPGDDVNACFQSLRQRIEVELGDGCSIQMVTA